MALKFLPEPLKQIKKTLAKIDFRSQRELTQMSPKSIAEAKVHFTLMSSEVFNSIDWPLFLDFDAKVRNRN